MYSWKFRIRSFGIGCWNRWVGHTLGKIETYNTYKILCLRVFTLFFHQISNSQIICMPYLLMFGKKINIPKYFKNDQITWITSSISFYRNKIECVFNLSQLLFNPNPVFFLCCLFLEFVSCFCIWLFLIDIVVRNYP